MGRLARRNPDFGVSRIGCRNQDACKLDRYVPDLAEDQFHVWITEYHFVPAIILGLALFASADYPSCYGAFSCGLSWGFTQLGW